MEEKALEMLELMKMYEIDKKYLRKKFIFFTLLITLSLDYFHFLL